MNMSLSPIDQHEVVTPRLDSTLAISVNGDNGPLLSWENITYSINAKDKDDGRTHMRTLLHGISGEIYPGEVIGLLGPSGAGKTTLLNVLAGRIEGGVLNGKVLFRGKRRVPGVFKRRVAYVEQEDVMFPMLTVEETIMFAARLRLTEKGYTQLQRVERVADVMHQLRLSHVKGSKIGDALNRGVSGGERKRVSIGVGLVTDPDIIVLDEPTSGLDSNSAEMVVELVRDVARSRGVAAVMTVHQPNANMLNCFDRILLLTQGRLVYFGSANQAIEYFESKGYPCPIRQNPADFFIDMMSLNNRSPEDLEASKQRIEHLAQSFDQSKRAAAKLSVSYGGLYEKLRYSFVGTIASPPTSGSAYPDINNSQGLASVVCGLIVTSWVIFGGHLANAGELLPAIKWMQYISPAFYIYEGMVQTEFSGLKMHCGKSTAICMPTGDVVIKLYKLDQFTVGQCALISICMAVVYNIIAYISLRWKAKPKYLWI
ncbi:hypothetical protein GGI12_003436 [Dipsacomyces acuminosporus]|nr:hypothetical protein GGI12_003436 [Dipsacomyces acuminosporus]